MAKLFSQVMPWYNDLGLALEDRRGGGAEQRQGVDRRHGEKSATMLRETFNVVSPEEFGKLFREESHIAEFASTDDENAYAKRDAFLVHLIRREVQRHFGTDEDKQLFVGDDWWPNHTRYIEAIPVYCTSSFFAALRRLLTDEYKSYRIQVCVWRDLMDEKSLIGSMVLYAERVLIEKRLHELLKREGAFP